MEAEPQNSLLVNPQQSHPHLRDKSGTKYTHSPLQAARQRGACLQRQGLWLKKLCLEAKLLELRKTKTAQSKNSKQVAIPCQAHGSGKAILQLLLCAEQFTYLGGDRHASQLSAAAQDLGRFVGLFCFVFKPSEVLVYLLESRMIFSVGSHMQPNQRGRFRRHVSTQACLMGHLSLRSLTCATVSYVHHHFREVTVTSVYNRIFQESPCPREASSQVSQSQASQCLVACPFHLAMLYTFIPLQAAYEYSRPF